MPKRRKSNNKSLPLFLLIGGGITLIVAAFLFANQNSPASVAEASIQEEIPYPEIARVSLTDAKAALESGTAILLDVRSAEAFAGQHVAGAVNIPTAEIETRLSELDPNAWIIPYCT